MRRAAEVLSLLLAIGLQISLWPELTVLVMPALVLITVLVWGYADNQRTGFRTAFIGGILLDLYRQQDFGMFTGALLLAYASTLLFRASGDESPPFSVRVSAAILSAVVYEMVVVGWIALTTAEFPFFELLVQVATLNTITTVVIFIMCQPLILLATQKYSPHHARSL